MSKDNDEQLLAEIMRVMRVLLYEWVTLETLVSSLAVIGRDTKEQDVKRLMISLVVGGAVFERILSTPESTAWAVHGRWHPPLSCTDQ